MYQPQLEHHRYLCSALDILFLMNFRNIRLLLYLTHKTSYFVAANQRIGKDPRCSSGADAPQSTASKAQPKRKAPTSTNSQPKWQKAAPSSPSHLMPQIQADPTDAPEQTIDPSDQGTSSAVAPKQTITVFLQGKISIMKSLLMNFLQRHYV